MVDFETMDEDQRDFFAQTFQLRLSERIEPQPPNLSIFSHKLDRVVFVAYLLGGIVPLVALGVIVERYQLMALYDPLSKIGLLGLVTSITFLSLGCFLMLRRMAYRSLTQIDQEKLRAASLLQASRVFAAAPDAENAAATAARSALALSSAPAAFVFGCSRSEGSPTLAAAAGEDVADLFESLRDPLLELANIVITDKRPAICNRKDGEMGRAEESITAVVSVPLMVGPESLGALTVIHTDSNQRFDDDQLDSIFTLADLSAISLRNANLRDVQRNFFSHVSDILVKALDAHMRYQAGHGRRVAFHANLVGHELKLDDVKMRRLHFAALFHDIGMLHIKATVRGVKECRPHALFGHRILAPIRLWEEIAPIVLHHHERFDGSGYPAKLSGRSIPLESRIIAVCDALDAMTSSTSYRDVPLSFAEATREIEEGASTQFDPIVVRCFLNAVDRGAIDPGLCDQTAALGEEAGQCR